MSQYIKEDDVATIAFRLGAADERAKIVAWLRENPRGMIEYEELYASSIEAGEHLK